MKTSREIIGNLLKHQPVERIPNGLGGCETTGMHVLAYNKLKKILGINDTLTRISTPMVTAIMEPSVLAKINGDIILLSSPRMCPVNFWGDNVKKEWKNQMLWGEEFQVAKQEVFTTDADGTIWWKKYWAKDVLSDFMCPSGGIYFDELPDISAKRYCTENQPSPSDYHPSHDIADEKLRAFEESARWLYENTDYSICCGETITDLQLQPGGAEAWWMRLIEDPDTVHEFLGKACEAALSQLKLLDQSIGKYTDMLLIAHDIGDARGVTIGPDLWREIYKPHYKKLFTEWHQITKMKVNFHCCGAISEILGDLIECGIDIFNPVQISANGMSPEKLKTLFGKEVIFYGGSFDAVLTPPSTPAEVVYNTVKQNITTLNQGGGYIFAGVHNIPGDTPETHLKAIINAYNDCNGIS